jgi:hypothetical protein
MFIILTLDLGFQSEGVSALAAASSDPQAANKPALFDDPLRALNGPLRPAPLQRFLHLLVKHF